MKVGILTLIDYRNYGNRLQNYAMEQVLKSLNCEVNTIVKTLLPRSKTKVHTLNPYSRYSVFRLFTKNNLHENNVTNFKNLNDNYDYFIVGSDQIWHPWYKLSKRYKFGLFADENKLISYAASIGVPSVNGILKKVYKNGIGRFKNISVREEKGAEIVKNLINKDVPVLVDPTMLVTKEQWIEFGTKAKVDLPKKYIFTYILGPKSPYMKWIENIAKENNLEIVDFCNRKNRKMHASSPNDFVSAIENASLICTDSFHASLFSIVLDKPFVVFRRKGLQKNIFSRLDNLLKKMNCEDRLQEKIEKNNLFACDFSYAKDKIIEERGKSINYLCNALGISNDKL